MNYSCCNYFAFFSPDPVEKPNYGITSKTKTNQNAQASSSGFYDTINSQRTGLHQWKTIFFISQAPSFLCSSFTWPWLRPFHKMHFHLEKWLYTLVFTTETVPAVSPRPLSTPYHQWSGNVLVFFRQLSLCVSLESTLNKSSNNISLSKADWGFISECNFQFLTPL